MTERQRTVNKEKKRKNNCLQNQLFSCWEAKRSALQVIPQ